MINYKVIKWLVIICILLVFILVAEWMFVSRLKTSIEPIHNSQVNHNESISLPKLTKGNLSIDHYQNIFEKPLFIQGRTPAMGEEVEQESTVQEVKKIEDVVLVGIYSIKGDLTALFKPKKRHEKSIKKAQGDDISGWNIKEIQADKVVLDKAGKEQEMLLRALKKKPKIHHRPTKSISKSVANTKKSKKPVINPFTQMLNKQGN